MDRTSEISAPGPGHDLQEIVTLLRDGREVVLQTWIERVRANRSVIADDDLTDPLLLDHLPQLYDAILDRIEIRRSREEAEQVAAIHGFTRRVSGYDMLEAVIEMMSFRHAIWAHLLAVGAPSKGALSAMEIIDGMIDRAVVVSLRAFLDPSAKMLEHRDDLGGAPGGPSREAPGRDSPRRMEGEM